MTKERKMTKETRAYAAGQDARLTGKGKKLSECPYPAGTPAARAWRAGWRAADEWIDFGQWLGELA